MTKYQVQIFTNEGYKRIQVLANNEENCFNKINEELGVNRWDIDIIREEPLFYEESQYLNEIEFY